MNQYYPNLGSTIKIAGLTLKNRMIGSPISIPEIGPDENLTRDNISFYSLRAKGGAAVITVSEGIVHSATGKSHTKHILLDTRMSLPSLTELARIIHRHNCFASMELSHGGKYAGNRSQSNKQAKRFGPVDEIWADGTHVYEMPEDLILEIADSFGKAAALVKEAGFDMVLVHGGHGWLINQFMSPNTNTRTDKWGGSFENRMRFPFLCVEKIREAVGPNFPIEFRMSGAEYTEGGYDINYGVKIAQALDGKVDLIHVSAGVHENRGAFVITHPSVFIEHGCNVHLAAEIKKHVKTPVATLGGLNDPDMMEDIIASGKADIVEMGRQLMADPFFPEKALTGRKDDITKCCRCFSCFGEYMTTRTTVCALNPVIGREREHEAAFAPTIPKKVLIAGGGPAGMSAALQASARGHEVILFEKNSRLGGALLYEEYIPFKQDLFNYSQLLAKRLVETNIEVRLNTELTPELAKELHADIIICAVGSVPVVPPILGIDTSHKVVGIDAIHQSQPAVGDKVVILGGGLIGTETSIYLDSLGKDVTVVEMRNDYAPDTSEMHKIALEVTLKKGHVKMHLNTRAKEVTNEGLLCIDETGNEVLYPADTILVAAGMKPNSESVEALRYAAPRFFQIGDCVKVGKVLEAVHGGYYGALDI
ncbi:FAD-dependent oxidoreductase [Clostridium autoethanogenum]|uniref:Enoate reductase n=3 Tax=Clostridium TaxID=1485 RepID=D8GUK7_CLOLD|nr:MULTISPECIES: FAD-dependent oxidoreductase [Clostridium]ADK16884.1 enoate reductase [Clostridium ljungdahlii DSM 13528]OAA85263.1 NADH oxidase [Clostridium ljungdahlii DSM 13528]RMC98837.1 FAD-dependent oxidoreductase [Clostridium autoethanogenum]